jgi:hypothetical protein
VGVLHKLNLGGRGFLVHFSGRRILHNLHWKADFFGAVQVMMSVIVERNGKMEGVERQKANNGRMGEVKNKGRKKDGGKMECRKDRRKLVRRVQHLPLSMRPPPKDTSKRGIVQPK